MARAILAVALLVAALTTACGSSGFRIDAVVVNGGEPQNLLIPTNANDSNDARILDRLFAGLVSYGTNGQPSPEVAQSIDTSDNMNYRIRLKPGWTFSDGSPVTAHSFVNAWNYGASATNAQLQQIFFSPIDGFDAVAAAQPTATTMSGLRVVSDQEFTVRLKAPTIDFALRLGFGPFYPLPDIAFRDMTAFGQNPIGNGPYKFANANAWQHNVMIDLVPNPRYRGNRIPHNKGLQISFYANLDTAYADLLSDNLDVLDQIPPSSLPVYHRDLSGRSVTRSAAMNRTLNTPLRLPHFGGEEGRLRRLALSAAINRRQICQQILAGTCTPASDFTAPSLPGFDPKIPGNNALDYDPDRARRLWLQANALSPWSGTYEISYNADGGHQEWVDAVANSIKNVLDINAIATPQPTFADFRTPIVNHTITTAFRSGWQGDYPALSEFLNSLFVTDAGANNVGYTNPEFDQALTAAESAQNLQQSYTLTNIAQRILLHDMPVVPLWSMLSIAGWSSAVSNVKLMWDGAPDYENIVKT